MRIVSGGKKQNSSPPKRASRSVVLMSFRLTSAIPTNTLSPVAWPWVSFTPLKAGYILKSCISDTGRLLLPDNQDLADCVTKPLELKWLA
jgi:hypothetical protein